MFGVNREVTEITKQAIATINEKTTTDIVINVSTGVSNGFSRQPEAMNFESLPEMAQKFYDDADRGRGDCSVGTPHGIDTSVVGIECSKDAKLSLNILHSEDPCHDLLDGKLHRT